MSIDDTSPTTGKRVLIVEDEEDVRSLIVRVLSSKLRDVPIDEAKDGAAALELLGTRDYGAILLDLMMPNVDGFEVIRSLSSSKPHVLGRIVVVTAATEEVVERVDKRVFEIVRK